MQHQVRSVVADAAAGAPVVAGVRDLFAHARRSRCVPSNRERPSSYFFVVVGGDSLYGINTGQKNELLRAFAPRAEPSREVVHSFSHGCRKKSLG